MPFQPGQSGNAAGRPTGAVGVFTKTVKETVLEAFREAQNDPKTSFRQFIKDYPKEAMAICAKLIPIDVKSEITVPEGIKVIFTKDAECLPIGTNPESNARISGQ